MFVKRIGVLSLLLALAVLLAGCTARQQEEGQEDLPEQEEMTPAERYLAETPKEELSRHFRLATLVMCGDRTGFTDPEEIPDEDLFRFAVLADEEGLTDTYDESTQLYRIPVQRIRQVLDQYFLSYNFDPAIYPPEGSAEYGMVYDAASDCLITGAIGYGTGSANPELFRAKALDEDTILVEMIDAPSETREGLLYLYEIRAQITEEGARFLSVRERCFAEVYPEG